MLTAPRFPAGCLFCLTGLVVSLAQAAEPNAFLNLSARGRVDRGENILIGGLVVERRCNVLLRGAGPSLLAQGVNDPVPHPRLTLFDDAHAVQATNAGWRTGIPAWTDASGSVWSKAVIGMPSVTRIGEQLAVCYDGNDHADFGHMRRDIGLALLDLPLQPPNLP